MLQQLIYDEWSIENAKENIAANNCDNINLLRKRLRLRMGKV